MKIALDITVLFFSRQYGKPTFSGVERVITEELKGFRLNPDVEIGFFTNQNGKCYHSTDRKKFPDYKSILEYYDAVYFPDVLGLFNEKHANCKAKIFVTVHDLIPILFWKQGKSQPLRTSIFKKLLRRKYNIDHFFCVSENSKSDLCSLGKVDPCDVTVTHLAACPKTFYPFKDIEKISFLKRMFGIPEGGKYLLVMSPLSIHKNLILLLRSFFDIIDEGDVDDLYLLVGNSQRHANDRKAIKMILNYKHTEKVLFAKHIPEECLSALYSGALALVFPSLYEGFGIPPLEAMQCGTPVITSNTSSLPEVVGDTGIMIGPKDRKGLAKSILELYRNEELRQELGKKGIERAKLFSWEKHCNIMLQTFCNFNCKTSRTYTNSSK